MVIMYLAIVGLVRSVAVEVVNMHIKVLLHLYDDNQNYMNSVII